MPAYVVGGIPRSVVPGQIAMLIGAAASSATRKIVTTATRTANVVTVTTGAVTHSFKIGQIVEIVGVAGTTVFNGRFAIATTPSATTFTYAQTAADDATGTGGTAESSTTEAVYANGVATFPVVPTNFDIYLPAGFTVVWSHGYNVNPTAVTMALQGALEDVDASYVNLDTDATPAGNTKVVTGLKYPFLRMKCTALTIGSGAGQQARIMF